MYYSAISLKVLRKTKDNSGQDTRSPGLGLSRDLAKIETEKLTVREESMFELRRLLGHSTTKFTPLFG